MVKVGAPPFLKSMVSQPRGYDINLYTGFEGQVTGLEHPYEENIFCSKGSTKSMMKHKCLLCSVYVSTGPYSKYMAAIIEHQLSGKYS